MKVRHVSFCLCPGLPLFGLVSMLEVFRHANRLSGTEAYTWSFLTEADEIILDNNGLLLHPSTPLANAQHADLVLVVAGFAAWNLKTPKLMAWVQSQAIRETMIGGISNGSFVLAEYGLLNGFAATTHWEDFASFCQMHPTVRARHRRWVIDRQRMTCSGGAATLDLAIEIVSLDLGDNIARRVSRQMLLEDFERSNQEVAPRVYDGSHHYSPRVQQILRLTDTDIDGEINVQKLADKVGLSRRALLRVIKEETGTTPSQLINQRKLERARSLIQHSSLQLVAVADAVGFSSQSHMTLKYREAFKTTPAQDRKACQSRNN